MALLEDDFRPLFFLLNEKSLYVGVEHNFTTRVASACVEGITNQGTILMSWATFFFDYVRRSFISLSIKVEQEVILVCHSLYFKHE